jgi:hypothetical protein
MTIIEAIKDVMQSAGKPMTPRDVLAEITRRNLYQFKAQDPLGVVRAQMRQHSEGYDKRAGAAVRCLRKLDRDAYQLTSESSRP